MPEGHRTLEKACISDKVFTKFNSVFCEIWAILTISRFRILMRKYIYIKYIRRWSCYRTDDPVIPISVETTRPSISSSAATQSTTTTMTTTSTTVRPTSFPTSLTSSASTISTLSSSVFKIISTLRTYST